MPPPGRQLGNEELLRIRWEGKKAAIETVFQSLSAVLANKYSTPKEIAKSGVQMLAFEWSRATIVG